MEETRRLLTSGLSDLRLSWNNEQVEKLIAFLKLIEKWNKAYNLTAVRQFNDMVKLHLLDSLTVLPLLKGSRVLDVGTGAGLPGIPLAVLRPNLEFCLLDSNAKKTRFVQQAVLELQLANVKVHQCRVEGFVPEAKFTTIVTRAFAALPEIISSCRHLLVPDGILLAMKGQTPDTELTTLNVKSLVVPLQTPGVEAKRCAVIIEHEALSQG